MKPKNRKRTMFIKISFKLTLEEGCFINFLNACLFQFKKKKKFYKQEFQERLHNMTVIGILKRNMVID